MKKGFKILGPDFIVHHSCVLKLLLIGPNKTIRAFQVTGLKISGRVGAHIFFI